MQRLRRLIEFMRGLPPEAAEHFDMRAYYRSPSGGDEGLDARGTTACALGWATTVPEFHACGLALRGHSPVMFEGYTDFEAARKFFGIDGITADRLFGPDMPATTPAEWADYAELWLLRFPQRAE